jgi:hypothetical protein
MPTTGGTADRGYGAEHQALREKLRPSVEAGAVVCWRCGYPIHPTTPWDLGHDDHDRTIYRGPEHMRCNRRNGAIKGNKMRGKHTAHLKPPPLVPYTDPDW